MAMILLLRIWIDVFGPQKSVFTFHEPFKFLSRKLTVQHCVISVEYRTLQLRERHEGVRLVLCCGVKLFCLLF